ncbi:hypothetical protein ACFLZV_04170 [Candidatus Margulisiibacteriota bacterium]
MELNPKLRNVEKYKPAYRLNEFPKTFPLDLGIELIYLLSTRGTPRLEGSDWEEMFARLIKARWKPSNVGLDDIVKEQTAWGAKTVKNKRPSTVSKIRLISGRNSPVYSFGDNEVSNCDPNELGKKVLSIWNERVASIRKLYKHVRTVVLIKSDNLLEAAIFEFETIIYVQNNFWWQWNERGNLEGFNKSRDQHLFTWQPHGSQFTIIETVPDKRLAIRIKQPPKIDHKSVLKSIKYDESWVEIISQC